MDDQQTELENVPALLQERRLTMAKEEKQMARMVDAQKGVDHIKSIQDPSAKWFIPSSFDTAFRVAEMLVLGRMLPKSYMDNPNPIQAAMSGIAYAMSLGITDPIGALANITVINGVPCLWRNLPLALAKTSPRFFDLEEYLLDEDGKRISIENGNANAPFSAAVCDLYIVLPNREVKLKQTVALLKKFSHIKTPAWDKFPDDMLKYKARARCLQTHFADIFAGMHFGEDRFDVMEMTQVDAPGGNSTYTAPALKQAPAPTGIAAELKQRMDEQTKREAALNAKPVSVPAPQEQLAGVMSPEQEKYEKDKHVAIVTIDSWLKGAIKTYGAEPFSHVADFADWAKTATMPEIIAVRDDLKRIASELKAKRQI